MAPAPPMVPPSLNEGPKAPGKPKGLLDLPPESPKSLEARGVWISPPRSDSKKLVALGDEEEAPLAPKGDGSSVGRGRMWSPLKSTSLLEFETPEAAETAVVLEDDRSVD
jgi:hypothetical protein